MATGKNSSDEDYLDSLLKAVLGKDSGQEDGKLNNDNEFGEEDLLGDIENELFSDGFDDIDAKISESEIDSLFLDDSSDQKKNKLKKRNKRRSIFGRKKKVQEDAALEEQDYISQVVENTSDEKKNSNVINEVDEVDNPEEKTYDIESDDILIPEGFENIFEDDDKSHEENDMQGLYDILSFDNQEEKDEEVLKLEEEKASKKKNKGLFSGKKKKSKKVSDIDEDSSNDSETEDDFKLDNPMEDLFSLDNESTENNETGLEEFGDMFLGGEEEDNAEYDENARLMEEMDNGEYDENDILSDEEEDSKKKKKKKKKKEKKGKKEKEEKEEKPKKEKKPKKPKGPKEPDVIIPIPKLFIVFSISLVILLVIGLKLGGDYRNYKTKTEAALTYYLNQDYKAAYNQLIGMEMDEDDQFFYDKLETIMFVYRHYESHNLLYELENYDQALHTLLRGIKVYDKYKEQAREYECFDDFTTILGWLDAALLEKYGITESQARELNLIKSRYEYAEKVYQIVDELK